MEINGKKLGCPPQPPWVLFAKVMFHRDGVKMLYVDYAVGLWRRNTVKKQWYNR